MSKFVEWSNQLSMGIEEIDAQHQVLVDLLNQVHETIQQHHSMVVTRNIITKLEEYTRIHFAVEESLMRILHYPQYEQHKEEHETLIGQLGELRAKLEVGKATVNFELANFLKGWLTNHIMEVDKAYTSYFLEKGINPKLPEPSWLKKLWSR